MSIEMIPVESSNVEAVGYDAAFEELRVSFLSGPAIYVYEGVPAWVHEELLAADTKGGYLNQVVKPNYACHII